MCLFFSDWPGLWCIILNVALGKKKSLDTPIIEPQKHEMLDFTLVPKLLSFFQWNYYRELVLLRIFFEGRDGNRK